MERSAYCHNKDSQISAHLIHHTSYPLVQVFLFTENNYIHLSDKKDHVINARKTFSQQNFTMR